MYACLFCIVCIYYTSTQDQIRVTSIAIQKTSAQEYKTTTTTKKKKLKTRSSKTAFSDHLKTKNKKTCPNVTPHKPAASLHVHQDHHAPVCVWGCVCLWVCVCVYPCVSLMPCLRKWRWEVRGRGDPPGDPNHTQAMHYRRNQRGGGSARGHMGSEVKGCRKMEEDKRGEAG